MLYILNLLIGTKKIKKIKKYGEKHLFYTGFMNIEDAFTFVLHRHYLVV
jgi:hypothetical protein